MSRNFLWPLALLPVGIFIAVAALVLRGRVDAGRGMPDFSIWSDDANGLAEGAHLLGELGWRPVGLTRPIGAGRDRGLLIIAEPGGGRQLEESEQISEGDARGILRWVEAGNTLLLCSRHQTALHDALQVDVVSDGRENGGKLIVVEPEDAGRYTRNVDRLSTRDGTTISSTAGLKLWPIRDRSGGIFLSRGAGRVVVVSDPTMLTRRGLLSEDNAVFLIDIADVAGRDGVVFFDEFHHGFQSAGGVWGYLGYYGQQLIFLPLALALGTALWSVAVRLGPAVATPDATSADAVDYASALALLYRRAGVRRLPARTLVRGFIEDLTRHLRLRRGALPAEILAAWRRQAPGASTDRLQNLLRGVGELRKGEVAGRQLLKWSRAFDEFKSRWLEVPR
jgi:hypothetical protein